jgi:hypothetical protein
MKRISLLCAGLIAFAPTIHAASPSSVAAGNGINPSTVYGNGGFDFNARDNGGHLGWCKGKGHLAPPGNQASGHRNHWECDTGGGDDGGGDGDPLEECEILGIPCDS